MPGDELAAQTAVDPGQVLASTREALGVTQREVSDALNLPINTVDAIERGDKSQLPPHVFTRGYVRAYAKLLEIDPDPLVAALVPDIGEERKNPLLDAQPKQSLFPKDFDPQILLQPKWLAAGGAVLIVLILLIWLIFSGGDSDTSENPEPVPTLQDTNESGFSATETSTDSQTTVVTPSEMVAGPDVVDTATGDTSVAESATQALSEPSGSPQQATVADSAAQISATPDTIPQAAVAGDVLRLTPTGNDRLSLSFTEDCWVEIKDAQGKTLYGDLGRVGQDLEFVGTAPYRVLLGYAPGVLLKFNAEPVALSPHTRNNVASLVLGQ